MLVNLTLMNAQGVQYRTFQKYLPRYSMNGMIHIHGGGMEEMSDGAELQHVDYDT